MSQPDCSENVFCLSSKLLAPRDSLELGLCVCRKRTTNEPTQRCASQLVAYLKGGLRWAAEIYMFFQGSETGSQKLSFKGFLGSCETTRFPYGLVAQNSMIYGTTAAMPSISQMPSDIQSLLREPSKMGFLRDGGFDKVKDIRGKGPFLVFSGFPMCCPGRSGETGRRRAKQASKGRFERSQGMLKGTDLR